MKKVFVVIAVAAAMAACNNSAGADGSASPADSAAKMAPDSVKAPSADSSSMRKDSVSTDTTKKM